MNATFPLTRWSQVLAIQKDGEERAEKALADLCQDYWSPLYAFIRRAGYRPEDAEDLTQGFFTFLIEKEVLSRADQRRGKLRSFLLTSLKNYMSDERDKRMALKRGGTAEIVHIDGPVAEAGYQLEIASREAGPDQVFDRQWALVVMRRVFDEVREGYESRGQGELFEALHPFLAPQGRSKNYRNAGERLGLQGSGVRVALFRMRQRYAEVLRKHLLDTVASEDEVAEEINSLIVALR